MASQILPLFPLSSVLLPTMPLPLHIFEQRYKDMMSEVITSESEFGIVLAKDDGIVNIGCTAIVANVVKTYPDGRLDLVATGQRRFRIESLNEDKSFLRATVEFFDDEDITEVPRELLDRAGIAFRKLVDTAKVDSEFEPQRFRAARLSFQMAQFISDLDKRQTVLSLRSEIERLHYLLKIMPQYLSQQEQIQLAKRVGPQNGHAKHLAGSV